MGPRHERDGAGLARLTSRLYAETSITEWENIPNIAREWPTWTKIDRIHALIDWPVVESNRRALEDYAAQGILTPTQTERYARLHALVTKYRPLLRRLMQD